MSSINDFHRLIGLKDIRNQACYFEISRSTGLFIRNVYPRIKSSMHHDRHQKYLLAEKTRLQQRMPVFADDQWGIVSKWAYLRYSYVFRYNPTTYTSGEIHRGIRSVNKKRLLSVEAGSSPFLSK